MLLKIGDEIYCYKLVGEGLTLDKGYKVVYTRSKNRWNGDDICILDDEGTNWWFGQVGETESWTNWFISEKEWLREQKLKSLLDI